MANLTLPFESVSGVLTVAELVARLNGVLRKSFEDVRVAGEISGLKLAASGHAYFTLKDDKAVVSCACWAATMRYLKFKPREGLAVIARGALEVYPPRGSLQLIVSGLEPQGEGALQVAFEQLKKKLEAEGLFAAERKRKLPRVPRRIGLITSPTGAVIRDMVNVLGRRFPGVHVRLYPAAVQGPGSVEAIVAGLDYFSTGGWAEVVIAGRGGGSLEDLWSFNEEAVARAIVRCAVPVISAVGHETDFTIADFVADLRAPTPSAAAELAVPSRAELLSTVDSFGTRAQRSMRLALAQAGRRLMSQGVERALRLLQRSIGRAMQAVDDSDYRMRSRWSALVFDSHRRLDALERRLRAQDLRVRFVQAHRTLEGQDRRLMETMTQRLHSARGRWEPLAASLAALSPLQVLERGYSVVETGAGLIVRAPSDAPAGTGLRIRTAGGRLAAESRGPDE